MTNQVDGRALPNNTTVVVCQFLIEEVICRYGCVGNIVVDRGELDAAKAKEIFNRLGVKLSLTTAYNPEANGGEPESRARAHANRKSHSTAM